MSGSSALKIPSYRGQPTTSSYSTAVEAREVMVAPGVDRRVLTALQLDQVSRIKKAHAERLKLLTERQQAARKALTESVFLGRDLELRSIALGKAERALALAHARLQTDVLSILTFEQREGARQRMHEFSARPADRAHLTGQPQAARP